MTDPGSPGEPTERELLARIPEYLALLDRERRLVWCNRFWPGLDGADVIGHPIDEFIPPAALERARVVIERVFATGESGHYDSAIVIDGAKVGYLRSRVVLASVDGEARALVSTQDLTEQTRVELALRESEARFRELVDRSPDLLVVLDDERRIVYANRYRPEASPAAVLGQRIDDLATPDLRDEVRGKLEHLFATGAEVSWSSRSTVDAGDYVVRASRLPGTPPRALVVATDVSHQEQLGELLRLSEERLERALQAGSIGLWELDVERGVVTFSSWFDEHAGISGTITLDAWRALVHDDDRRGAIAAMDAYLAGDTASYEQEYHVRHARTGEWRRFLARGRLARGAGGRRVLIGSMVDVTEMRASEERRHELQRQLEHAQRLESLGQLAGGVAHDFNNLLTVVLAGVDVARRALRAGQAVDDDLDQIAAAASRGAELTRRLLAFGRRSSLRREALDVGAMVRGVGEMARRVLPATITIDVHVPDGREVVAGDPQQLEQVLLNVCLNARDAMPEGGRLELSVQGDEDEVVLTVRDSGCGIPQAHRHRIFEPFFTTKPAGSGTGLGLSMAHGLVHQHGGRIEVESEVGRGTTFTIRLPRHEGTPARRSSSVPPPPQDARGTVLIAEDEPLVRGAAARVLESAGYRVIQAVDGLDAVEIFDARSHEIDLVVLDAVMPRLDGWGAYQRIRALRPEVPVLFCSGYTSTVVPHELGADAPPLITKPFRADALVRAAREAIRGGG